ncbi:DUF6928 family protein [Corynebacterium sp. MNWGS58]|uniref:DUF6928 family protein n=1 Tax=Corynebacterium sp. 102791.4 TaxID=3104612 RepID=UPI0035138576
MTQFESHQPGSPDPLSDGSQPADRSAVLTLWFVDSADNPADVLASNPVADRGFGRKYLAQMYPSAPITLLGQFPLNRSAQVSADEFYIGAYPGVTVVQTIIDDALQLSALSTQLRNSLPATDLYAFAFNDHTGFGGIAHWHNGELYRSLTATRYATFENEGLPDGFEAPLWAGERSPQLGGIALPFAPADLLADAHKAWLGVNFSADGPDIDVVGFALDGRPEPKFARERGGSHALVRNDKGATGNKTAAGGRTSANRATGAEIENYDDYEDHAARAEQSSITETFMAGATTTARVLGKFSKTAARQTRKGWGKLREQLRHLDRD